MEDNKTIDMEIKADTTELDEAIDKAETLQEARAGEQFRLRELLLGHAALQDISEGFLVQAGGGRNR